MNNFERFALEGFLERQLGERACASFRLVSLAAQGWDVTVLTELAAAYARTPSAQRRFDIEFIEEGVDPRVVFKRHLAPVG